MEDRKRKKKEITVKLVISVRLLDRKWRRCTDIAEENNEMWEFQVEVGCEEKVTIYTQIL